MIMKKFRLPVTWSVSSFVEINAETIEDAIKKFNNNVDKISLPVESEYVPDSFCLTSDDPEYIKNFNK